MSKNLNNIKELAIKIKLFLHNISGIDCPKNSSITISLGSELEKLFFTTLFKNLKE